MKTVKKTTTKRAAAKQAKKAPAKTTAASAKSLLAQIKSLQQQVDSAKAPRTVVTAPKHSLKVAPPKKAAPATKRAAAAEAKVEIVKIKPKFSMKKVREFLGGITLAQFLEANPNISLIDGDKEFRRNSPECQQSLLAWNAG